MSCASWLAAANSSKSGLFAKPPSHESGSSSRTYGLGQQAHQAARALDTSAGSSTALFTRNPCVLKNATSSAVSRGTPYTRCPCCCIITAPARLNGAGLSRLYEYWWSAPTREGRARRTRREDPRVPHGARVQAGACHEGPAWLASAWPPAPPRALWYDMNARFQTGTCMC